MKTATMDIPFELQYLKQISELSEALFPSCLQAGYHVNCVPGGSWVHCGEVPKAMQSGELSYKCRLVIYVWYKELCINVKPNCETHDSLQHQVVKIPRVKFLNIGP